jgi:hypothetical protein
MSDDKNQTIEDLKKLRDELRVKMRLGEMEAKEWWAQVEPKLIELEQAIERGADKAATSANLFIDEMATAFRRMRDRMGGDEQSP